MLINLTDVFTSEGKVRRESFTYEPGTVEYFGFEYPILSKTDAEITFQNIGNNRILLTGTMELDLEIPCDRCLQPVRTTVHVPMEYELASPEATEQSEDADEISFNMPTKILCKPDCKGICKVCGKNLNEGDCGCDQFVPDPRMAAIKDIYDAFNKEV